MLTIHDSHCLRIEYLLGLKHVLNENGQHGDQNSAGNWKICCRFNSPRKLGSTFCPMLQRPLMYRASVITPSP